MLYDYTLHRKGPLTMNPSTFGAFGFNSNVKAFPNI